MKTYNALLLAVVFTLCGCTEYQRERGCTLDKLNLKGDVVRVETIIQTTEPLTEMLANSFDPEAAISTSCGNLELEFDNRGYIKKYSGYGMKGEELFSVKNWTNQSAMKIRSSVMGESNKLPFDDIEEQEDSTGRVVESDYVNGEKLVYRQKAYYDKFGDLVRITKNYEEMKIVADKNTVIETVDTTYFEYLSYDKHHNWTEALVSYRGMLPNQKDCYKIKRQITYNGDETVRPLIESLARYNNEHVVKTEKCGFVKMKLSEYGDMDVPDFMASEEENKNVAEQAAPQGAIDYLYTFGYCKKDIYATLNISTSPNNGQLDFDGFTDEEMQYNKDADTTFLQQFGDMLSKSGIQLLKWLPYGFERINGKTALVIRYYRYGKSGPIPVYVESYTFCMDDGKTLNLIYSVQSNQFDRLQQPFQQAVHSIQFNGTSTYQSL
jgi:hypothetical protein